MVELNTEVDSECVAMNDDLIVGSDEDGKLHVFANSPKYPLITAIEPDVKILEFMDSDVLMCTCFFNGILFISISRKSHLPIPSFGDGKYAKASCLLSASTICIGGDSRCCVLIEVPMEAADLLENYLGKKKLAGPVKKAFIEVREGILMLKEACSSVLSASTCSSSIPRIAKTIFQNSVK